MLITLTFHYTRKIGEIPATVSANRQPIRHFREVVFDDWQWWVEPSWVEATKR